MSHRGHGTPACGSVGHKVVIGDIREESRVAMTMSVVVPVRFDAFANALAHARVESCDNDDIWVARRRVVGGLGGGRRGAGAEEVEEEPEKSDTTRGVGQNGFEDLFSGVHAARVGGRAGGRVCGRHGGLPWIRELHGGHVVSRSFFSWFGKRVVLAKGQEIGSIWSFWIIKIGHFYPLYLEKRREECVQCST